MTEFRKAPDGQPTSNIELQLRVANSRVTENQRWRDECQRKLNSAISMQESDLHHRDELEWQLAQRRIQEFNGL